jgi:hypothetical protein
MIEAGNHDTRRNSAVSLLPILTGAVLLLWGIQVVITAFAFGSMPIAGWHTEQKRLFGLAWLAVFVVVLLPSYLYAIETGLRLRRAAGQTPAPRKQSAAAIGVTILLVTLTMCARVAVTAWFPEPMHPPFQDFQGGLVPGVISSLLLLILEAGVLVGIKRQTRRDQKPYPLLIPACFAALLLVWTVWIVWTAFTKGLFPVVLWRTEYRHWFGLAWAVVALVVLLPAYLYAIGLGILGFLRRHWDEEVVEQNFWLVAITNTAFLCALTFGARVAVTAWFPEPMHPPFDDLVGGPLAGLLASAVLGLLTVFYYRVAREF